MAFKLTYGTMSDPPQEMHDNFDLALENVKQNLGEEYPMIINGEKRFAKEKHQSFPPSTPVCCRQASARHHYRRVAWLPGFWRLERLWLNWKEWWWLLLPALIHARTVSQQGESGIIPASVVK